MRVGVPPCLVGRGGPGNWQGLKVRLELGAGRGVARGVLKAWAPGGRVQ